MEIPYHKVEDGITVDIKVIPRSSKKEIAGASNGIVKVKLTSPPVEGEANAQLIELLSKHFKVSKGSVSIIKGETSRNKTVKIKGAKI
jgi:uncharacterized protein (TIGR00251 family)